MQGNTELNPVSVDKLHGIRSLGNRFRCAWTVLTGRRIIMFQVEKSGVDIDVFAASKEDKQAVITACHNTEFINALLK